MTRSKRLRAVALLAVACLASACDGVGASTEEVDAGKSTALGDAGAEVPVTPCSADESAPVPSDRCASDPSSSARPVCEQWTKVEPAGAQCSDGSQYKFFVNYSGKSNNLVLMFEGGGACWDYASCSGGARGAANAKGIPDTHMDRTQYMNLLRRDPQNPLADWNMVFVPYCTGDVHTGSKVATYTNPSGGAPLTFRHLGHDNTQAVIGWIKQQLPNVPRLLVTGYSAGGIGALQNYYYIREGLPGVQCGYLLNDSGPAFHSDGPSQHVQAQTRAAWGVDALLDELAGKLPVDIAALKADVGLLNTAIADKYRRDRLSMTVFEQDLNYSLYSYERFFPGSDEARIHELWSGELTKLLETYRTRPNLSYYVPYFRRDNCSHCVSIPPIGHDTNTILMEPWLGTEIEQEQLTLRDYLELLIDDARPLKNYREQPQPNEKFTAEESAMCMTPT